MSPRKDFSAAWDKVVTPAEGAAKAIDARRSLFVVSPEAEPSPPVEVDQSEADLPEEIQGAPATASAPEPPTAAEMDPSGAEPAEETPVHAEAAPAVLVAPPGRPARRGRPAPAMEVGSFAHAGSPLVRARTAEPPLTDKVGVLLSPESEFALHRDAFARGGGREKSRIVGELTVALLDDLDRLPWPERATRLAGMAEHRRRDGVYRTYLLPETLRGRLRLLSGETRIDAAAVLRTAIEGRYPPE